MNFNELKTLVIREDEVSDKDLAVVANIFRLDTLCVTEDHKITGEILKWIKHPESITHLELRNTNFADDNLRYLRNFPNLEYLDFTYIQLSGAEFLKVCPLPKLKTLEISSNRNCDDWFRVATDQPLVRFFTNYNPLFMDSHRLTDLSDVGLESLNRNYPDLCSLDLFDSKVTLNGLTQLRHFPNLQELKLDHLGLSGAYLYDKLKGLSRLQILSLDLNPITRDGLQWIASLRNLTELSLRQSLPLETGRLKPLIGMHLISIDLSGNSLSKDDFLVLAKIPTLRRLVLNGQKIESWELEEIAKLNKLRVLDLSDSRGLSKECLRPLTRQNHLMILETGFSDISDSDREWLQKQLPKLDFGPGENWRTAIGYGKILRRIKG